MSSRASHSGQVLRCYQLFNDESYEEKVVNKPKGADIAAIEASSLEPMARVSSIISSQGIAVVNDIWYVLGKVKSDKIPDAVPDFPIEEHSMLFVCTKGVTVSALQCHFRSYGIWSREADRTKYIITVGEDYVEEAKVNLSKASSSDRCLSVVIKIWNAEKLMENQYESLGESVREESKDGPKLSPRIIYLDRIVSMQYLSSVSISTDLTHIALGLGTGGSILVQAPEGQGSLYRTAEKTVIELNPESQFATPVTSIYVVRHIDEEMNSVWRVFCTCDRAFYVHEVLNKKVSSKVILRLIAKEKAMDGRNDMVYILDSGTHELRQFKGLEPRGNWPMKELGRLKIVNKQIMVIHSSEKNKSVRVYDMDNEIVSYQKQYSDILAETTTDDTIYLLTKSSNSIIMHSLKEKNNIDKLEAFLYKKHYDVAYKFAENEKFSEEVLADISRQYGSFFLGKVSIQNN